MSKDKKIIFINIMMNMYRGGGENYDLNLSKILASKGYVIECYFLSPLFSARKYKCPDYIIERKVRSPWLYNITQYLHTTFLGRFRGIRGIPRMFGQFVFELRVFFQLYKRRKEDFIIHSCGLFVVSMLVEKYLKKQVFLRLPGPPTLPLHFYCMKKISYIVANGDVYQKLSSLSVLRNKLLYLNVGIDFDYFSPCPDKEMVRERLQIPKSSVVFMFSGRFVTIKNVMLLLEAFNELLKVKKEGFLILAGDGPMLNQMRSYVKEKKIDKCVYFFGMLDKKELAQCYSASDVFVLPSNYDNYPNSVLEAMASGLAVVATNVGGIPLLLNEKNGIIVPKQDVHAMKSALMSLMGDKERLKKMSDAALKYAKKNFSWELTAQKFCTYLRKNEN